MSEDGTDADATLSLPSLDLTRDRLAHLTTAQRDTLAQWLADSATEPSRRRYPLSPRQRGMWFVSRQLGRNPAYNIPWRVRVRGRLQAEAVRAALEGLVRRHEVLRTRFGSTDGVPWQEVDDGARLDWELEDLVAAADQATALERVVTDIARTPFDLERTPLLRAGLVRLSAVEHVLVVCVHHIVFDGWSMRLLNDELWTRYTALVDGRAPEIRPLPLQYGEVAREEHERLRDSSLEREVAAWAAELADAPAVLDLPTGRLRPAPADQVGEVIDRPLDSGLLDMVGDFARSVCATSAVVDRHGVGGAAVLVQCPHMESSHALSQRMLCSEQRQFVQSRRVRPLGYLDSEAVLQDSEAPLRQVDLYRLDHRTGHVGERGIREESQATAKAEDGCRRRLPSCEVPGVRRPSPAGTYGDRTQSGPGAGGSREPS